MNAEKSKRRARNSNLMMYRSVGAQQLTCLKFLPPERKAALTSYMYKFTKPFMSNNIIIIQAEVCPQDDISTVMFLYVKYVVRPQWGCKRGYNLSLNLF